VSELLEEETALKKYLKYLKNKKLWKIWKYARNQKTSFFTYCN